ncbi:MAG: ribonuclease P protein subunit [Methanophagales archaeon]|nr:ribonuclease P protein subunit [Methanophagales archaeon]MCW3137501.1 ribonuclease P protein subunit [Methanophagales archaeon]MCW3139545.1 ribonuclease P protein subunit [Methanophagales archaeon]MCW7069577.1 ribonuclease P protein subunit [Methanophagales archaeon]MCW7072347.1 ribonuclease P protein subunit [Methanophagales archaeon]
MKIKDLPQEELIGLIMEVEESSNRDMEGLFGRIVDETRNTFVIETEQQEEKRIPKAGNMFIFVLEDGTRARIRGDKLLARPEDRIKRGMQR